MDASTTPTFVGSSTDANTSAGSTSKSKYLAVRLTTDQVQRFWHELAPCIVRVLNPGVSDDERLRPLLLQALMANKMQAWLLYGDGKRLALATTRIVEDYVLDQKNLHVVSLFGYERVPQDGWRAGMEAIRAYARGCGCRRIMAYTSHPGVLELGKVVDNSGQYSVLMWEV